MSAPEPSCHRPLDGVTVLDFTRVLAGPFCTVLLGDVGADIIKVEPLAGDEYRRIGPFHGDESALFLLTNRGKRSVALDLKQPAGLEIVQRLARAADVVVENFRPGVAARLGVDYDTLAADNPGLVYASISGFGQRGPLADRPAYDLVAQAMSGLMDLTGEPDGAPSRVGESIGDLSAGLYGAWAITAGLFARERSGVGTHIDVAMFDALFSLLPTAVAQWMVTGRGPTRVGNRHPVSTPFGAFRAGDGYLVITVLNDGQFARLCALMGQPELADDARFRSDALRTRHEPALRERIEAWSTARSVEQAVQALTAAQVPAAPICSIAQAIDSAQVAFRGLMPRQRHPRLGAIASMEQPVHFAGSPRGDAAPAPALGEHTREVLEQRLGLGAAEIRELEAAGTILAAAER